MKKALLSLLLAFVAMPMFGQSPLGQNVKMDDTTACGALTWRDGQTYDHDTVVMYVSADTIYVLNYHRPTAAVDTAEAVELTDSCYATYNNKRWLLSGSYLDTLRTVSGCDSLVVKLNVSLSIGASEGYEVVPSAECFYLWAGDTIRDLNVHNDTLPAVASSCDSIVHLSVATFTGQMYDTVERVVCDSLNAKTIIPSWDSLITTSGVYTHNSINGNYPVSATTTGQCVRHTNLNVTVVASNRDSNNITPMPITVNGCSYTWGGQTITDTENHFHVFTSVIGGCDSVAGIRVTSFSGVANDTTKVDYCGSSYVWVNNAFTGLPGYNNGFTFNKDTVAEVQINDSEAGCVTNYVLDLHFYIKHDTTDRNGCDQYVTNSATDGFEYRIYNPSTHTYTLGPTATFTTSGYYEVNQNGDSMYTYVTSTGCATRQTLHITIKQLEERVRPTTIDTVVCDRFRFKLDGDYRTITRTCQDTTIVSHNPEFARCYDSILTLSVVIKKSTSNDIVVHACDSYTWEGDNVTYTYNTTKSIKVDGGNAAGCDSSMTLQLTVDKTPNVEISGDWVLQPGDRTILRATADLPIATYKWYVNHSTSVSSTADTLDLTVYGNTDVYLEAMSTKNCPSKNWITLTATVGIDGADALQANIYPNPTARFLNIESAEGISQVEIYNTVGQQVILRSVNTNSMQLDLNGLSAGNYTLRIMGADGQQTTRKFIVNK